MRRWIFVIPVAVLVGAMLAVPRCARGQAGAAAKAAPAQAALAASPNKKGAANESPGSLLAEARDLVRWQHYQEAETLLKRAMAKLPPGPQGEETFLLLAAELGAVYLQSGSYEQALAWHTRALSLHERKIARGTSPRARSQVAMSLAEAYAELGQTQQAVETLRRAYTSYDPLMATATAPKGSPPARALVDPAMQLELLVRLAALGETTIRRDPGSPSIEDEIERLVVRLKADFARNVIPERDYSRGMRSLAAEQQRTGHHELAAATLRSLIDLRQSKAAPLDAMGAWKHLFESLDIWQQLAGLYSKSGDGGAHADALKKALELAKSQRRAPESALGVQTRQRYEQAELEYMLGEALLHDEPPKRREATVHLAAAKDHYRAAIALVSKRGRDANEAFAVGLNTLLDRMAEVAGELTLLPASDSQTFGDAIRAHEVLWNAYEKTLLPEDPRIGHIHMALGGYYSVQGKYSEAQQELQTARAFWESRNPKNYPMLARTLNMLGENLLAGARANEDLGAAKALFAEAATICQTRLPQDELVFWVQLNQGRLETSAGRFQPALDRLLPLLAEQPNRVLPNKLRSAAMLNVGLVYKEMMQLDKAIASCQAALALRRLDAETGDFEFLPYYEALGGLYIALHDSEQLKTKVVDVVMPIANRLDESHPDRMKIQHYAAMVHYLADEAQRAERGSRGDAAQRHEARKIWQGMQAHCEGTNLARVLHYLARLDYLDWATEASALSARLASMQGADFQEYQAEFNDYTKTKKLLDADLAAYLKREQEYTDSRARYINSQADDSERLRLWNELAAKRTELTASEPKLSSRHKKLDEQHTRLVKVQAELAARSKSPDDAQRQTGRASLQRAAELAKKALDLLDDLEKYPSLRYAAACNYAQILGAQWQWLDAGEAPLLEAIAQLEKAVALVELSRESVSGDLSRAEFFEKYQAGFDLLVRFNVQAGRPAQAIVAAERARSRTLLDQRRAAGVGVHLNSQVELAAIVERWKQSTRPLVYYYVGDSTSYVFLLGGQAGTIECLSLKAPRDGKTHSAAGEATSKLIAQQVDVLRGRFKDLQASREITGDPAEREKAAVASDVLLPAKARDFLAAAKKRGAPYATIIPHRATSKLPLETLVLNEPSEDYFLADICPPLAYAPSLAILDESSRVAAGTRPLPHLVTVGNPDYAAGSAVGQASFESSSPRRAGLQAQLGQLTTSEWECEQIKKAFMARFGAGAALKLTRRDATELKLVEALAARPATMLHLAAHGLLPDDATETGPGGKREGDSGGMFGSIALTPSSADPRNDGFLEWREIYALNLEGCELVVLSACNTNVSSSQRREEPDFSLAGAFLASGARRVLATAWEVTEEGETRSASADATSEQGPTGKLIASFMEKVIAAEGDINYAQLWAKSRDELRRTYPSPYYWAPFVLVGPGGPIDQQVITRGD